LNITPVCPAEGGLDRAGRRIEERTRGGGAWSWRGGGDKDVAGLNVKKLLQIHFGFLVFYSAAFAQQQQRRRVSLTKARHP
jgi:hypothetical protein